MTRSSTEPAGLDRVIEALKANYDITLIRAQLARTPAERLEALVRLGRQVEEMREGLRRAREGSRP